MLRAPLLALLACLACSCAVTSSRATDTDDDPDAGYRSEWVLERAFRVGVRSHGGELGGDFDGNTVLIGPDTTTVPDAGEGDGFELMIGGISKGTGFEFSYTRMHFDDVRYENIALNGLYYFQPNQVAQPYFLFGVLFPWATLENASTDGMVTGDGKLSAGFGVQVGGGLSWFLADWVAFDVRAQYAWQEFSEAEGVLGIEGDIDDGVVGESFTVSAGLTFSVPLRGN